MARLTSDGKIQGVQSLALKPSDAKLIFHHHNIDFFSDHKLKNTFTVDSGATSIKWGYTLNTNIQQTIGGEVIQILSCYVGPMSIEGTASSVDELLAIKNWFKVYFKAAGSEFKGFDFRDESAVTFKYPARGWSFYIQPTNFDGMTIEKSQYAVPWSLEAEIVSDNALDYLSGVTMHAFTGVLLDQALVRVGYSDPTGTGRASRFVNPLITADNQELASNMGDSFQRLIAGWADGDFANFAYGALSDGKIAGLPASSQEIYKQLFGSDVAIPGVGGASGGASSGQYTYAGGIPTSKGEIVGDMVLRAHSVGIPAKLVVAISLHESNLSPDARSANDGGPGVDGVGFFQVHYGGRSSSPQVKAASITHRSEKPTKYYDANLQIQEGVHWISDYRPSAVDANDDVQMAEWAFRAQQGVGYTDTNTSVGQCTSAFAGQLREAEKLIAMVQQSSLSSSGVVAVAQQAMGKLDYSEGADRWQWNSRAPGHFSGLATDCSGFVTMCYKWGTGGKVDPSGQNFAEGFTGTMLKHGTTIRAEQAKAGDVVIYISGPGSAGHHTALFLEDWKGGSTRLASHGGGRGSKVVSYAEEAAVQSGFGAPIPVIKRYQ